MQYRVLPLAFLGVALADLPIHCLHSEAMGTWEFHLTHGDHDNKELCGYRTPDNNKYHFDKYTYEFVEDESKKFTVELQAGSSINHDDGAWTMVYDEGFELAREDSKFFAFFDYTPKHGTRLSSEEISDYTTDCHKTRIGWYHGPNNRGYGCYYAEKTHHADGTAVNGPSSFIEDPLSLGNQARKAAKKLNLHHEHVVSKFGTDRHEEHFHPDMAFIEAVNTDQSMTWRAKAHDQFKGKHVKHMQNLVGKRTWKRNLRHGHGHGVDAHTGQLRVSVAAKEHTAEDHALMKSLPDEFDWRDVDGVNYVTPVRNQGSCGSCYAMAAMSIFEARLNIKMGGPDTQAHLSSQDVLSCSATNQGCEGGYPYLVTKYGAEYGFVAESCLPYSGTDSVQCSEQCEGSKRYRATDYKYVGGYYGGCNEAQMMKEIHENGPVVVAFEAPGSLFYYDGGVFTGAKPKSEVMPAENGVNDWEQTNHAVVCVGWGVSEEHGKYWIIKNEWGDDWGEHGYLRIRKGTDECGIESMAVAGDISEDPVDFNEFFLFR